MVIEVYDAEKFEVNFSGVLTHLKTFCGQEK